MYRGEYLLLVCMRWSHMLLSHTHTLGPWQVVQRDVETQAALEEVDLRALELERQRVQLQNELARCQEEVGHQSTDHSLVHRPLLLTVTLWSTDHCLVHRPLLLTLTLWSADHSGTQETLWFTDPSLVYVPFLSPQTTLL